MTAIERLEAMLDEKDAEIESLQRKLNDAEERAARNHRWTAHIDSKEDPNPDLPIPRLEIRWRDIPERERTDGYAVLIRYDLVIRHLLGDIVRIPIGGTRTDRRREIWQGKVDLPFRDGAHIMHDAAHLRLPAYAIDGEHVDCLTAGPCDYEHQRAVGAKHRTP